MDLSITRSRALTACALCSLQRVAKAVLDGALKLLEHALTPLIDWVVLGQQLHFADGP